MTYKTLTGVILSLLMIAPVPAFSGSWQTQVVLPSNAYNGTVALDANVVSVWYQNSLANGTGVNEIWASSAPFGHAWSTPVNISGNIGVASGNPSVRSSAAGNSTAIYTDPTLGAAFVDHPSGGSWGTPSSTGAVNQFYVNNDRGDEGLAYGGGGPRGAATPVSVVQRPAGGSWTTPTTIATGTYVALDGSVLAPDGTMAVAWESYNSVCGSRTCKTSNWTMHVSTHAPGASSWVDSGTLLGPDTARHFGQLAADNVGDIGVAAISGTNVVSIVRHGTTWNKTPAVVAPLSSLEFYTGTGRDNRVFASDSTGHATIVSWGNAQLSNLVAADGNLSNNTWGKTTVISGPDQNPNYFYFTMSSSGASIAFWSITPFNGSGNTLWRAATQPRAGQAWNPVAPAGTSFDGGGTPESVAINSAGQAAVVFHGYSSDFLTFILYTNTYQP
jgi:hypothetical protein